MDSTYLMSGRFRAKPGERATLRIESHSLIRIRPSFIRLPRHIPSTTTSTTEHARHHANCHPAIPGTCQADEDPRAPGAIDGSPPSFPTYDCSSTPLVHLSMACDAGVAVRIGKVRAGASATQAGGAPADARAY